MMSKFFCKKNRKLEEKYLNLHMSENLPPLSETDYKSNIIFLSTFFFVR